jgi:APA family basic amino acid/polyamine antiporter
MLTLVLSAALVPIGSVKVLAEMSSFAALVAFFAVNLALIALRYKHPHHPRPFRVPGSIAGMPVLPVLALVSIVVLLVHFDWPIYLAGAIALACTAAIYGVRRLVRCGHP